MNYRTQLSAVAAAACMTLGGFAFGDGNNVPQQAQGSGADMSAAHAQPNTNDANAAGTAAVNGVQPKAADMRYNDPVSSQINAFAKDPDTAGDKLFALKAGCGNNWEVAFSKLEADKGSDPKVKELANMVAKDHAAAEQKLEPIASKLGVAIPTALPAEKQALLNLFSQMPADKLDKIYLSEMKAGHLMNVAFYSDHVKVIKDADLRTYASETLPKLREHTGAILKANDDAGMTTDLNFHPMAMNQ